MQLAAALRLAQWPVRVDDQQEREATGCFPERGQRVPADRGEFIGVPRDGGNPAKLAEECDYGDFLLVLKAVQVMGELLCSLVAAMERTGTVMTVSFSAMTAVRAARC